jgi:hypothetical protein
VELRRETGDTLATALLPGLEIGLNTSGADVQGLGLTDTHFQAFRRHEFFSLGPPNPVVP